VQDALCSSSDESHDAILGLYCQRFDIQVGVAGLAFDNAIDAEAARTRCLIRRVRLADRTWRN